MNTKLTMTVVPALLLMLSSFTAEARRGPGPRGPGGKGMFGPRMARALDLSPDQRAQIKHLRSEMKKEVAPIRKQLGELREKMKGLWDVDSPDEGAILALMREMAPLRLQIKERAVALKIDVLELLTPDQREKFRELKHERRHHRKAHRGARCHGQSDDCPFKGESGPMGSNWE